MDAPVCPFCHKHPAVIKKPGGNIVICTTENCPISNMLFTEMQWNTRHPLETSTDEYMTANAAIADINEMIRLRETRSPAINQMRMWAATIGRMALGTKECHECGAMLLYECPACSASNYPADFELGVNGDAVERAARALFEYQYSGEWEDLQSITQTALRVMAQIALVAAQEKDDE